MIIPSKLVAGALSVTQLLLFAPGIALAQEQTPAPGENSALAEFAKNLVEGRSLCLDNYNFNSVDIEVDADKSILDHQYLPGETITVTGTVHNPNLYPLVGGRMYAHVLREDATMESDNWHPYVAQEFVPGSFDLGANQKAEFEYAYRIPQGSPAGTYKVELYYLVGGRYVMSGIPYVANFPGESVSFTVQRPTVADAADEIAVQGLSFDRNAIKVNGQPFALREIPVLLEPGKSVQVEVPVTSLGGTVSGTVQMDLYNWSITDGKTPIISKSIPVTVTGTKATPVSFTWDAATSGTYELVLSATTANEEAVPSVLNVRFPVAGLVPRIVYSGVGNIADGSATINACVVNATFGSGTGSVTNTVLVNNKAIQTKEGSVSADQLATALITIPLSELAGKAFDVHVVAKDAQGAVTDETTISYPKDALTGSDGSLLPALSPRPSDAPVLPQEQQMHVMFYVGIVLGILVVLIMGIIVARNRNKYPKIS